MKAFEIFIKEDKVTGEDWQRLIKSVAENEGNFLIEIEFATGNIGFYLYCQKDASLLATLEGFILRPTDRKPPSILNYKKTGFKLSSHKNILEAKEDEELKKQKTIQKILIGVRKIINAYIYSVSIVLSDSDGQLLCSSYHSLTNPLFNFEFDFKENVKIKKKSVPIYLKIDEATKLFSPSQEEGLLEVFGFPNFSNTVYFPLKKFDFGKHSLIVGQTGVGKSKFIELFIKDLVKESFYDEYTVVIIDPHASLYPQFLNLEQDKINFDFVNTSCDLFPSFSEPKISTELTILLFKTLLKDQFNAKMERTLKYALYVLFLKNQMSLTALQRFLTELEFRKVVLENLGVEYDYLTHFFETEFVEMQTKFYEIAIMPILVLIDELNFVPAFSNRSSQNSIEEALKNNFLISFSLNRIFLGEKATRLIAGLIIQQLFLIAQKRSVNKKVILIIDEVSLVENEGLISILSEARKFDLSLFLSQQYLTQISPDLLKGILSNVFNYFVFKISDEDAKILSKNLDIAFPDQILIEEKKKGLEDEDLKRNLLVTLNPRELLVRAFADGKFYPCFKAKTMDVN